MSGGFFRREAHPVRRSHTTARSSLLPLASTSSVHSIWTCLPGVGESSSRSTGSVFVGVGVSVLRTVHEFGSVNDVPLGVVQVGQRRREQPVLLAVDVVVQQGDHRLDPGQVARGDGVEVGVQFVVFGAEQCDVFGEQFVLSISANRPTCSRCVCGCSRSPSSWQASRAASGFSSRKASSNA